MVLLCQYHGHHFAAIHAEKIGQLVARLYIGLVLAARPVRHALRRHMQFLRQSIPSWRFAPAPGFI